MKKFNSLLIAVAIAALSSCTTESNIEENTPCEPTSIEATEEIEFTTDNIRKLTYLIDPELNVPFNFTMIYIIDGVETEIAISDTSGCEVDYFITNGSHIEGNFYVSHIAEDGSPIYSIEW